MLEFMENGQIKDEKLAVNYINNLVTPTKQNFLDVLNYPVYEIMEADNISDELKDAINNFATETNYFGNLEYYSNIFGNVLKAGLPEEELKTCIKLAMHEGNTDIRHFYNPDGTEKSSAELLNKKHHGNEYEKAVSTHLLSDQNDNTRTEILNGIKSLADMPLADEELTQERNELIQTGMPKKLLKYNLVEQDPEVLEQSKQSLNDLATTTISEQRKENNGNITDFTNYLKRDQEIAGTHQVLQEACQNFEKGSQVLSFSDEITVSNVKKVA